MKQMTLIEMDGFLKGKCIPSDLKANETNAEYLVRKLGELESKLETALRECRSAGITIDNLEARCAKLAAENKGLKKANEIALKILNDEETLVTSLWASSVQEVEVKTPATDVFLAEVRSQGVEMFSEKFGGGTPLSNMVKEVAADFAAKLRKGGNQ